MRGGRGPRARRGRRRPTAAQAAARGTPAGPANRRSSGCKRRRASRRPGRTRRLICATTMWAFRNSRVTRFSGRLRGSVGQLADGSTGGRWVLAGRRGRRQAADGWPQRLGCDRAAPSSRAGAGRNPALGAQHPAACRRAHRWRRGCCAAPACARSGPRSPSAAPRRRQGTCLRGVGASQRRQRRAQEQLAAGRGCSRLNAGGVAKQRQLQAASQGQQ